MPTESKKISSLIDTEVWAQRNQGIDIYKGPALSSMRTSLAYMHDNIYAFFQIIFAKAVFSEEASVKFIPITTGLLTWNVHDYEDAISVASPHDPKFGREIGMANMIAVVAAVAEIVMKKGWDEVELIDGTSRMKFLLWVASKRYGFALEGYTPAPEDERRYTRLMENAKKNDQIWEVVVKPAIENIISGSE